MEKTEFEDVHSRLHRLREEISRGGQGVVYRTENPDIALKLELRNNEPLLDSSGNEKYQRLRALPVPSELHVTMPGAVLKDAGGYVMTLLSDMISFEQAFFVPRLPRMPRNLWLEKTFSENKKLGAAYLLYYATGGLRRRLNAYYKAAAIVAELHENGLVYCDFSHKNLFVSALPDDAAEPSDNEVPEVWLIDADNLHFCGNRTVPGAYTPTYCAPEVFHDGKFSFASDCYAFAAMLFETLSMTHPFKGKQCEESDDWEEDWEQEQTTGKTVNNRIDGGEFPWIQDKEDRQNAGRIAIAIENCVSDHLRSLFDRTFCSSGKMNPKVRPSMMEWADELARCLDHTAVCPKCGMGFDAARFERCPWCDGEFPMLETDCFQLSGQEKGRRLWSVRRECWPGREASIPRRVLTGFAGEDESAFTVQWKAENLFLRNLTKSLCFECREGERWVPVSGSIRKTDDFLSLRVTDAQDGTRNIVEVRIKR